MLRSILATSLCLGGALAAPVAETTCTRDFLKAQTDAYVAAQVAGKPDGLKAASDAATYTQNFKASTLASGILATPLAVAHNRSTFDTTQCATYTEMIVTAGTPHVIGTQMRFDNSSGALTKVETLVTSKGDWLFDAAGTLKYASQEDWGEIAEDKRDSREVIQAVGDAYLDLFNDKNVKVPWGTPCARLEGGSYVQPCSAGIPSGIKHVNRRYVIDEVLGAVDIMFDFAGADPDSHEFRVEGGDIRFVHTITVMTS
ncbi:hypothetical protein QBC33DRAFT_493076 [Phialemonium atrogriseum]|uniref:DUF8021 domain-containing protein n=1 Tax=Phialemonium atrogriseum TaxID=1093897 RepID=A0AAJ0C1E7_9PEZI|nr:uncharacterized protein QBC33DRAFT_493076 [Phialemonium atrogriseum]KAK1766954.1 hypothetical protein QBC33DRAFT_493076 [Phialemonium atrogriseum]